MALKYCYYDCQRPISFNPDVWQTYKAPILTNNRLYNLTPVPGDPDYLLASGSNDGYLTIKEFYKDVCDALGFNPFTITGFYVNAGGVAYDMLIDTILAFTGSYETNNDGFTAFYDQQNLADHIIGYFALGWGDIRATIGLTGTGVLGWQWAMGSLLSNYSELATNDGIQYQFFIEPEDFIEKGEFDFSEFYKYEGKYRACQVKLVIYQHDGRYYWYIKLHNYLFSSGETTYADTVMAGRDTGHIYEPDNPYDNHQKDGNEGGGGGFDNDSDPNDVPPLPNIDVTALGGIKLMKCRAADIATLFTYLTSHDPGDSILKWFSNPIQGIVSCYYLPYPVEVQGSSTNITVLGIDTGAAAYLAAPWTEYNMGSMYIETAEGDCFLDYAPYSKASIYLPFIGVRPLDIDEIVKRNVGITYQFDNISGACVAFVTINGSVRYTYSGSCAVGIPLTQENWGQFYISAATAAAGALAGGVGAAGTAIAQGAGAAGAAMEGVMGAVQGGGGLNSLSAKPSVSRSGSISGAASALGMNKPYIILQRPVKAKVANPAPVTGLACGRTLSLGSLSGYNIIEHVHLDNIPATGEELDEIERLLYQGAIF